MEREARRPGIRGEWSKPVLVQRPLELTQAWLGPNHDALSDRES